MTQYFFLVPMKAKSRENQLLIDGNPVDRFAELRFHVYMYGPRYRHSLAMVDPIIWKKNNRFLVQQGAEGGEFFVYLCCDRFTEDHAIKDLEDRGYVNFLAAGLINSTRRIIRFEQPTDTNLSLALLRRITIDDFRLVEYYGGFQVVAKDGKSLGKLEHCFSAD